MSAPAHTLTPDDLLAAIEGITATETDVIAVLANVAALVFEALPEVSWAGFYILRHNELVLGPFQGRVACTRIALGKGVCGYVAQTLTLCIVPDVAAFPGHIACDAATASEIVLPIVINGSLFGVLDLDSPRKSRFTTQDQTLLEAVVAQVVQAISQSTQQA